MNSQKIVDYVMNTPHNTNPAILKQMIDANGGSSGGTVKSVNGIGPDKEGNVELYNPCDALELVTEMGLVSPVTDENGVVLTDGDGAIFTF